MNLVEWLKAATIEREVGLLKALSQVPMPKKVPTEGSHHALYHSQLELPSECAAAWLHRMHAQRISGTMHEDSQLWL